MAKRVNWEEKIGLVFGRLTIVELIEASAPKKTFKCLCSCGKTAAITWGSLNRGYTRSCGCLRREISGARSRRHGLSKSRLHGVWLTMKTRCSNKNHERYRNYGGRGIAVCETWREDFITFHNWAMANGYAEGLEIDRRDNDGPYSPDNCRFVTGLVNSHNTQLLRRGNKSGYRGVSLRHGRYCAQTNSSLGPKLYREGFKTAEEAARYRDAHCIKHSIPLPLNFKE